MGDFKECIKLRERAYERGNKWKILKVNLDQRLWINCIEGCVWGGHLVLQGGKKWPCFALGIKSRLFSWTSKALVNWPLSAFLAIFPIVSIVFYTQSFTSTGSVSIDSTNCISKMLSRSFQKSPKSKTWIFPALATIYIALGNLEMI